MFQTILCSKIKSNQKKIRKKILGKGGKILEKRLIPMKKILGKVLEKDFCIPNVSSSEIFDRMKAKKYTTDYLNSSFYAIVTYVVLEMIVKI